MKEFLVVIKLNKDGIDILTSYDRGYENLIKKGIISKIQQKYFK